MTPPNPTPQPLGFSFPWKGDPSTWGNLTAQSWALYQDELWHRRLSTDSLFLELDLAETLFLNFLTRVWSIRQTLFVWFFSDGWVGHWEVRILISDLVMYLCIFFSLCGPSLSSSHSEARGVFIFLLLNSPGGARPTYRNSVLDGCG